MNFDIDTRTLETIEELGGSFFAKGIRRYTRRGSYISLWLGVINPEKENLSNYNEYKYLGITIYIEKKLYAADTITIRVRPQIPFFPRFYILSVALWPISRDGSIIFASDVKNK
jgi:hypothetical protein